jgi:hypothetical protein
MLTLTTATYTPHSQLRGWQPLNPKQHVPCWDDGRGRRHRNVSHQHDDVAPIQFGDWCLPVSLWEMGPPIPPHVLPQIPPYATRNCRTSELGAGGAVGPPQSPPTETASASLGATATSYNVDVLRKSPVIINEAFFARWDRTDCVTPGTMWFGVNRNRYGQYPFISQRWDEVMHLVSDWDPLSKRRRFLDGVRFKGGFKRARQAWRYATLFLDERTPCPPSLTARIRAGATRASPVRY